MKVVTVVPLDTGRPNLGKLLDETERRLRGKGTTLIRTGKRRWVHAKYPGAISWEVSKGGILVAEIRTKKKNTDGQLVQAFVGYLDRHLARYIDSISILYYPD